MSLRQKLSSEQGSAVAEFSLVSILVTVLALSILQLGLFLHVRNSLVDIAVQSAHYASLQSNDLSHGQQRANELLNTRFPLLPHKSASISIDDAGIISVEISATMPLLGFLGPNNSLQVSGHAVDEDSW